MRAPRTAAGFTLLEAIVTLVIVSLLVTLLMQALGQSLRLRERLLHYAGETRRAALQEAWFRDSVAGAVADLPDALGPMRGGAESLELVSAAPLGGGSLQRVRWTLRRESGGFALHYADATWPDLVVLPGPLREAAFDYLDAQGQWQREWAPEWTPPAPAPPLLPRMVRLRATTAAGGELLWLVPIASEGKLPEMLKPEAPSGL